MDTLEVQKKLVSLGYDVGPDGADGIFGRNTIAAVKKFQKDRGLDVVYPGTIGPRTIKALGLDGHVTGVGIATTTVIPSFVPWLDLCIRKKGLHERSDYKELRDFLRSDGKTLGDPRELPWCGDLVETCIALTCPEEKLPGNPYLAANWATWGIYVRPTRGAIMSFWRQSPESGLGHVAFYDSESATHYNVWGGNQNNTISKTSIAKERLRRNGSRWPSTVPLPGTGAIAGSTGTVTTNEA
jgi:hypothetical protein